MYVAYLVLPLRCVDITVCLLMPGKVEESWAAIEGDSLDSSKAQSESSRIPGGMGEFPGARECFTS